MWRWAAPAVVVRVLVDKVYLEEERLVVEYLVRLAYLFEPVVLR